MSACDESYIIIFFRAATKEMLSLGHTPEELKERIDKIAREKE